MAKYLDPKADLTFKKVFGEHKELLISFLNALLPLPDDKEIVTLEPFGDGACESRQERHHSGCALQGQGRQTVHCGDADVLDQCLQTEGIAEHL